MTHSADFLKGGLADEVALLLRERLEPARAAIAAVLLDAYLVGLSAADLDGLDATAIYGAVLSLLAFAREREPGKAKLRAFAPDPERDGWNSRHSVIEIVNDDMPFLVDSVAAELSRQGLAVHLLVHPVLGAHRDHHHRLEGFSAIGAGAAESLMHIEIDRQDEDGHRRAIQALERVLDDVRGAVADWAPMRAAAKAAHGELAAIGGEEAEETAAFLDWLHDDHFTFLGWRRFAFGPRNKVAVEGEGLGLLRSSDSWVFDDKVSLADMPADVRAFLHRPDLLMVTKSARYSTVHRPVHLDVVGVKRCDSSGRVIGMDTFVGLFTAAAYTLSPAQIPLLRHKVERCMARAAFSPHGHDAKALANILETYPRDELFQSGDESLFATAVGILRLQARPRAALFVRKDEFERFVSCLVFLPRDRYDTPLRLAVQTLLESAYGGKIAAYTTQVADLPLARLHVVIRTDANTIPAVDERELEARIAEAARSWSDLLQRALVEAHGEIAGLGLARRYGQAFPASYRERVPVTVAVADIDRVEQVATGGDIAIVLSRPVEAADHQARLKLFHRTDAVALSDLLPMLEAMGLKVIAEVPHDIRAGDQSPVVWIHDFEVESADGGAIDLASRGHAFEEALARVWRGEAESDGFNRLVLKAGLDWRQIAVLRAYAKYLRQAGGTYSQSYIERATAANPAAAAALVGLFLARFDPAGTGDGGDARAGIEAVLADVESADDDRILRRFLNLIDATLRTNYFQRGADGAPKPVLAFKLDSRAIDDLPAPRPLVEIWVYSPRVEAVHLRGGRVARGGIRWSDRREDFRTEVLGLMKAQMVKNAVIVPVGAKGGFVVKRPPAAGGRDAFQAEGIACYKAMMGGLLDLTDNLAGANVVPPEAVIRHDGDDPYLVVAADKGTATFSDIANAISVERGFWLGDAFASGGSRGYDHKVMGITARGAWEAVKRHFREMGVDCQADAFTAIAIGDMSGDVFGNGMLQSPTMRLVAAFNHSHIFIDPDPDPARSFAERRRLFDQVKAWPDYDPAALSPGGGIFLRSAKTIPVSAEMKARFGLEADSLSPNALIRALLVQPVDLLFFGGIGTYVKARSESQAEAGDRANDALRIDGGELKARVLGEGANLAVTQLGRIDYARSGGRINTDAIDNSAGVDTSDHEVNIKILLDALVSGGDLTPKQRDTLLVAMTDEVAALVLRDNILQTQAISVMEAQSPELLDACGRFMRLLEKAGRLDRAIEFLPDDDALTKRAAAREGLLRPELAVLLAYAKIWLYDSVIHSNLPDDPFLGGDLARYFPTAIRERFAAEIPTHRLHREIIATTVTNSMVNRVGVAFVAEMMEKTGFGPADIARAYIVARDAYRLRDIWREVEALNGKVPAAIQSKMMIEANRLLERATAWVLRSVPVPFNIGATIAELSTGIAALEAALDRLVPPELAEALASRAAEYVAQGATPELARRVASLIVLASAADIVRIATGHGLTVEQAGGLYFAVGSRFALGSLRLAAQGLSARGHWDKLAAGAAIEELYGHQRAITITVAVEAPGLAPAEALTAWIAANRVVVDRADALLAEIKALAQIDLAMLTVVNRQLRTLSEGRSL